MTATIDYLTATRPSRANTPELAHFHNLPLDGWADIALNGSEHKHLWYRGVRMLTDEGTIFTGRAIYDFHEYILLSGAAAGSHWERVLGQGDWRFTRVDVQVTVRDSVDVTELLQEHRASYSRISSSDINGQTLYIGARGGERFWRIYDKAAQMRRPDLAPLWRWEVELRGRRAEQAQRHLERFGGEGLPALLVNNAIGIVRERLPSLQSGGAPPPLLPRERLPDDVYYRDTIVPWLRMRPAMRRKLRQWLEEFPEEQE